MQSDTPQHNAVIRAENEKAKTTKKGRIKTGLKIIRKIRQERERQRQLKMKIHWESKKKNNKKDEDNKQRK